VQRKSIADAPNRLWYDATSPSIAPRKEGVLRRRAGRLLPGDRGLVLADHIRSELVVDALEMARWRRRPEPGTILHSHRRSQYTSWIFGHRLRQAGLLGSMGRAASAVDNTMMESFWSTMHRELCGPGNPGQPKQRCRRRSSNGSKLGTTPAAATPASASTSRWSSKHFTPPPNGRLDQPTRCVYGTGASFYPIKALKTLQSLNLFGLPVLFGRTPIPLIAAPWAITNKESHASCRSAVPTPIGQQQSGGHRLRPQHSIERRRLLENCCGACRFGRSRHERYGHPEVSPAWLSGPQQSASADGARQLG